MNKKQVREIKKTERLKLTRSQVESMSLKIADNFFRQFDFTLIKNVFIYLPKSSQNEVNTRIIISRLWKDFRGINVYVPKITGERTMDAVKVASFDDLIVNDFGVDEPKYNQYAISPKEIDLIVLPLIAFDKLGNRIGYGKGYYDKYLKQVDNDKCIKCGLAFELQRVEEMIETSNWDRKVDYVVTEQNIYGY